MTMARLAIAAFLLLQGPAMAAQPKALKADAVEKATAGASEEDRAKVAKLQMLLDRNRFSVGEIDGRMGENVQLALDAFRAANGMPGRGPVDAETWDRLAQGAPGPVLTTYKVRTTDVKGPFARRVPSRLEDKARLPGLYYSGPREALAERFHVSEAFLAELNPGRPVAAGAVLTVPVLRDEPKDLAKSVERVEVDKAGKQVRAYLDDGRLVATYPATIGSDTRPAPTGDRTVEGIADKPGYTYNPAYRFEGVKTDKPFVIKPGPNNPVGSAWIDLSADGYGIHGTPDPGKVGKTASHGCVRLANWDARELLGLVRKGTLVRFIEPPAPAPPSETPPSEGQAQPQSPAR